MSPRKGHCARKLSRAARDTAHPRSTHACSSTQPSSPSIRHTVQGARTDWNTQVSEDASIGTQSKAHRQTGMSRCQTTGRTRWMRDAELWDMGHGVSWANDLRPKLWTTTPSGFYVGLV
ncbi:hypothetical protein VNO78_09208 [Psophocarpus tetragonolobus]|uniref:Uncharacterized protein n=1 Tax=Psophocarpus tetragonolobus TaxID=3891 RepID=A0AAN9SVT8_PSOTE